MLYYYRYLGNPCNSKVDDNTFFLHLHLAQEPPTPPPVLYSCYRVHEPPTPHPCTNILTPLVSMPSSAWLLRSDKRWLMITIRSQHHQYPVCYNEVSVDWGAYVWLDVSNSVISVVNIATFLICNLVWVTGDPYLWDTCCSRVFLPCFRNDWHWLAGTSKLHEELGGTGVGPRNGFAKCSSRVPVIKVICINYPQHVFQNWHETSLEQLLPSRKAVETGTVPRDPTMRW